MPAPNVDLVLVVDASESMSPCFAQLKAHLREILQPMQGLVAKVRYGLVAQSTDGAVYRHFFVCGGDFKIFQDLYSRQADPEALRRKLFTESPQDISRALDTMTPEGDEDMLLALDVALDLPFGPIRDTKRVVALFSDEPFEDGVHAEERAGAVAQVIEKIQARRIQLFCAVPEEAMAQHLAQVDRSEIEFVDDGDGLAGVDFKRLFQQMGKSISAASLQSTGSERYKRALFGQDEWTSTDAGIRAGA